jgi:cytochrome c551/c552
VDEAFSAARGQLNAVTYQYETASGSRKERLGREIEEFRKGPFRVTAPPETGGERQRQSYDYAQLETEYNRLRDLRTEWLNQQAALQKLPSELRQKRDAYLSEQLAGLNRQQMRGLLDKMESFKFEIKQIHVAEGNLVDRCESCHLGIREPVTLTRADVGPYNPRTRTGHPDGSRAFTSHPRPELLKIHDPERFGCSPCHGGNGRATSSVEKGHGRHKYWLWPLYYRANMEAGCNQCHSRDIVISGATILNEGKELYRWKGCMGCHRYEGFDAEPERLFNARLQLRQLEQEKANSYREAARLERQADRGSPEMAARLNQQAENLRVNVSRIDARIEAVDAEAKELLQEVKKVGPSLKEVKMKLRKEWLPGWIENPQNFRPGAKMPSFRLQQDEVQAIAAFIWQSGVTGPIAGQQPGDPARGKELFETRGCLACHSMGEGEARVGGTFAANLTRVGEKMNFNYLVRWIHNPRERTLPYSPTLKRDITPEDYAKKGLPFRFGLDNSKSPVDGHEMQVQQQTVMPSLRLNWQEVRDIASYLMNQKRPNASYPAAAFLDDPQLKAKGRKLAQNYGCAGCHEIAGLEDEGRIGTELTAEGSKPIERLDFALLTHEAEEKGWYNHKGFFERKLAQPDIYDQGKVKAQLDRLKMPNFNLSRREIRGLTTFLLGSVEPTMPPAFFYRPADQRRDIQEGWWVIKKYNCQGCHVVEIGQRSTLMDLPRYQEADWKEQLPPRLTSQGARVSPEWLIRFLKNPALSETENDRNGVRQYLKARMPTFYLSDNEVRKLVRFFEAVSYQPQPYIQTKLEPLTPQEQVMARQLFTSKEAPCLKCHATGNPAHDRTATAPNFLLAKERLKPGWTGRWLIDPARISPGTSMPSGLFKPDGARWVFSGQTPDSFKGYSGDHVQLLVRYMFQLNADEQRRLGGGVAAGAGGR